MGAGSSTPSDTGVSGVVHVRGPRYDWSTREEAGVHADPVAGDPTAGDAVAALAARWGFAHPGRFATAYRAAYGFTPRRTLDQ
ncbi:hypothetical protein [Kocuria sp. U4B]